ncbi:hypothetical protein [Cardinium endosymbiont of Nabis limbatus]|uniref:hypothetical protein n=1 Tax=Cardinium endosymbiont of Nabis limbatus TaxID=3066217 RepID=UPI003AF39C92
MKKTIQKITEIIALSASLVGHVSAFDAEHQADDKKCPWHIGIKAWIGHEKDLPVRRFSDLQPAIGPFVEWKPFDGVGIQTGLIYSYNSLRKLCDWREVVSGCSGAPKPNEKNSSKMHVGLNRVEFHAISIPLSIWFYPGSDRQFALHGGLRLVIPLSKAKDEISYH